MTRRFALHTLAIAAAALTVGTPAEAGGGVRLTFGGPLPSFVATPTPGYGGGSGYSAPRKASPAVHAHKRKPSPPVVVTERHKPAPARVVPVRLTPDARTPKVASALPVTASETETPGLLGRTLVLNGLPRAETVHSVLPSETVRAQDVAETADLTPAPLAKEKPAPKVVSVSGPATCRKFIPAVGVTVTVACD